MLKSACDRTTDIKRKPSRLCSNNAPSMVSKFASAFKVFKLHRLVRIVTNDINSTSAYFSTININQKTSRLSKRCHITKLAFEPIILLLYDRMFTHLITRVVLSKTRVCYIISERLSSRKFTWRLSNSRVMRGFSSTNSFINSGDI